MTRSKQMENSGSLLEELVQLKGAGLLVVPVSGGSNAVALTKEPGVITLAVDEQGVLPQIDAEDFDMLLTSAAAAPAPWVSVKPDNLGDTVTELECIVEGQAVAATVVAQVLRMSLKLNFDDALLLESLAYSLLQASSAFRAWRERTPIRASSMQDHTRINLTRTAEVLNIRLDRPHVRNAVDARMRDALVDALEIAVADTDATKVVIAGAGPSFCAGGDLNEFGQADDPGISHLIRTLRSPVRLIYGIRERVHVNVHGACIGAGIEMSAAAAHLSASPGAFFRLPEVAMGLMPGAGGTASIPRRIGRHRACFMSLKGRDIDARTALAWGLIDTIDTEI
jgi:hypothetical protein